MFPAFPSGGAVSRAFCAGSIFSRASPAVSRLYETGCVFSLSSCRNWHTYLEVFQNEATFYLFLLIYDIKQKS